ncbi:MAG: chemotaxis protein CheB [Chloroflexi bacterium]|nr:chemotaxis protein CheB [Chloroflexota bacterium]
MSTPTLPSTYEVVACASSVGGLDALSKLLSHLPGNFAAPLLVVQHLEANRRSLLSGIIGQRTKLRVKEAAEGDVLCTRTVYIAAPDKHLLVTAQHTLALTDTPRVERVRPSADLLFESVASAFGVRAIAVVLTGTGCDGANGVRAIKQHGGLVIAQNEHTSASFDMPGAAIATGAVDFVLPLDQIAAKLIDLVQPQTN